MNWTLRSVTLEYARIGKHARSAFHYLTDGHTALLIRGSLQFTRTPLCQMLQTVFFASGGEVEAIRRCAPLVVTYITHVVYEWLLVDEVM